MSPATLQGVKTPVALFFSDVVQKPYYDDDDIPSADTDSDEDIVIHRTDREWKQIPTN